MLLIEIGCKIIVFLRNKQTICKFFMKKVSYSHILSQFIDFAGHFPLQHIQFDVLPWDDAV